MPNLTDQLVEPVVQGRLCLGDNRRPRVRPCRTGLGALLSSMQSWDKSTQRQPSQDIRRHSAQRDSLHCECKANAGRSRPTRPGSSTCINQRFRCLTPPWQPGQPIILQSILLPRPGRHYTGSDRRMDAAAARSPFQCVRIRASALIIQRYSARLRSP